MKHISIGGLPMQKRRLGRNGPEVSARGLGCMGMRDMYGARDDDESSATIHHALDTAREADVALTTRGVSLRT